MKKIILSVLTLVVLVSSCNTLGHMGLKPSHLETVMALKDILNSSTFKAIRTLKNVSKNGVSGLLPKEVNGVLQTLKTLGYDDEINDVTKTIGAASKLVLGESEGIMKDAIGELKFKDAAAVVLGGENAATNVLKRAMYDTVKKRYSQKLRTELAKTDAGKYWPIAVNAYSMFSSKKINSSLEDFLAERAVDGMFLAIGKQEAKARTDYKAIGSNVVNKVFDYYTKNKK